ncbi:protein PUTATIVE RECOMBINATION INITIATION DEFECT 1 isoform X2 [Phragmites australis]|uniref:protein PUTATIVE RECOMBINATION INITIATION DEFECT 1 isoform X2 n=1 Tax=Phragmites australis TaxID=29695 RepID=UPI002D7858AF|nr:protein PUTATIVE RECOMBINATION INITIATION DEFECT 1 isoform X2 [Phragmites australis]
MESDGDEAPPHACGVGHRASHSLPTSAGGRVCLSCAAALLSSAASAPSHHVAHALATLSLALADPAFLAPLRAAHPRLLAAPLAEALAGAAARRDAALAVQACDLAADLAAAVGAPAASELVARLARVLSSGSLVKHLHTVHCLGLLLNSTKDAAAYIGDKLSLFFNLVNDLRLPSDEIRGEILFVLYKLSILNATPWDNVCDNGDVDLSAIGRSLLQLSLEVLLKTQNDAVRLNCVALLLTLAKKGPFDILLLSDPSSINCVEGEESTQRDYMSLNASLVLFAEAIKGSLLSTDLEVQTGTLDLIFHFLSSDANICGLLQTLIDENVADYVFEVLRLSGNNDLLVISSIQVLSLLARSEEKFKEKLAIGLSTLLPVLHYVAEIPFHPVQSHVLRLVWICMVNCSGILSLPQEEQIACTLTAILRRNGNGELGMSSETFILVCSILIEILKSPHAHDIEKLPPFIEEASKYAISSTILHEYDSMLLVPHSLLLLKEALIFCFEGSKDHISGKKDLEDSIIETCGTILLHWLESAVVDGNDEETLAGILQIFQIILSRTSDNKPFKFAELLASSSWFSLSFGFMGLFPTDHVKSAVYLVTCSIVDRVLGCNYGEAIRDAYIFLPSDPTELMYLLGQCSSEDFNLASCQCAILVILYACSFYNERLAADNQILASVEQYILLNGGTFPHEINGSVMLTLLVHLYAFVRGISYRCSIPHSPEAEKTLFRVMTRREWDLLVIRVHPVAVKWLFQKEELMEPLALQMLNFCKTFCEDETVMLSNSSQLLDIQMVAELVLSGETSISLLLVSLLNQIVKEGTEDEVFSVVNVITEILMIFPCTSDQFISCGFVYALRGIYSSSYPSRIKTVCSCLIFSILYSARALTFSQEDEWLALTVKLLEFFSSGIDYASSDQEHKILIGILCLILHHSANKVLVEPAKAIILNNSLVSLMDAIVHEAYAKGPSLFQHNQETAFGEFLILILLLVFFSLRSLNAILEVRIDWQDFLQHSNDAQSFSVLGIPCHDLCCLMHFGPSSIKLIASQCLLELLTRISDQRICLNAELRCSVKYLKSIIAVIEGLVFSEDSKVAGNCGACLSVILGWEKFGSQEKTAVRESKWFRLIMEEFAVALTAPGLTSKSFTNQQKFAANIAVSLLKLTQVPDWLTSLFDSHLISGIVASLSARNVTAEIVNLFSELMAKKYLSQEHIVILHNLFQVCRRQVYEGSSKAQLSEQMVEKVVRNTDDVLALLFGLMPNQYADSGAVQGEQQKLLREIDLFFQESSRREQH